MRAQANAGSIQRHSFRKILFFWAPLAATWIMMALEGPFLAAVIARLTDPTFNLAAHGVAYAVAILVEAPVIMLMSASTALVEDADSYHKLRRFTRGLNVGSTALLLLVLIPPVYQALTGPILNLPPNVADLTYGALWLFLPWPAAIGYRRFLHGLLIRAGRTRLVALGTVLRLVGMASTGLVLYFVGGVPGAWVGAASLSVGVVTEAVAARLMAGGTMDELQARDGSEAGAADGPEAHTPRKGPARVDHPRSDDPDADLTYRGIVDFYVPLALTSFIGLTVQPMLTFFMGRAPMPLESLAVFPVVAALSFLFRAPGLAFQEAAIALLGRECEHAPELGRFAVWLGLAVSGGLSLVAFTPLADVWFVTISGLSPELAEFAVVPARIVAPLPALSVLLSYQRAVLVQGRTTRPITVASAIEVVGIALLFSVFGWGAGMVGVTAATVAFVGGRLGGNLYLVRPMVRGLRGR